MHVSLAGGARRVPEIVRELDAAGVVLEDLGVRRPSLDDVFLTLTGRAADAAESKKEAA